jgi:ZIP family zinc transporter
MLALDALAPSPVRHPRCSSLPPDILALYLGSFAGFLLYIGAADILPRAHSQQSSPSRSC